MTSLKRTILDQVKPIDIFQKYIDADVRFGKAIKSPLRHDKNPSFNVYRNETGNIYYKDFGGDRGDCFHFVMRLFDVDFKTCLEIIAKDFGVMDIPGLTPMKRQPIIPKIEIRKRKEVDMFVKPWSGVTLRYWEKYGITKKVLEEYNVKSLEWFSISGFRAKTNLYDPIYCFDYENGGYKFYRPMTKDKKYKFLCNTFSTDVFGLNQLGKEEKIVVICAGQKDVLSLYSNTGIRGISLNSEKNIYHESLHIKVSESADTIMICYDRDETGMSEMSKISTERNIPCIDLRVFDFEGKDISDYFADTYTNAEEFISHINQIKHDNTDDYIL